MIKLVLGCDILFEAVKGGLGGASGMAKEATRTRLKRVEGYEKRLIQLIQGNIQAKRISDIPSIPGSLLTV